IKLPPYPSLFPLLERVGKISLRFYPVRTFRQIVSISGKGAIPALLKTLFSGGLVFSWRKKVYRSGADVVYCKVDKRGCDIWKRFARPCAWRARIIPSPAMT